jgi:hypothetical protein
VGLSNVVFYSSFFCHRIALCARMRAPEVARL